MKKWLEDASLTPAVLFFGSLGVIWASVARAFVQKERAHSHKRTSNISLSPALSLFFVALGLGLGRFKPMQFAVCVNHRNEFPI